MSSSDSDDDCYGNVAKKLQSLKNKYVPEKDDVILSDAINSDEIHKRNVENIETIVLDDFNATINSTDNEELTLDAIIANNSKGRPGRKRKSADKSQDNIEPIYERVTRSSRRKTVNSTKGSGKTGSNNDAEDNNESSVRATQDTSVSCDDSTSEPARRGRRGKKAASDSFRGNSRSSTPSRGNSRGGTSSRGNSRGGTSSRGNSRGCTSSRGTTPRTRGRGGTARRNNFISSAYPLYSVGNTDEYPDMCDAQELFSTNTKDCEIVEENDPLDNENEELSVKVYWQNNDVVRFNIRKYQKLTPIFKYFSDKENVGNDKLLFMYNDRIIKIDDTPDSINYSIAKFIDGGIVNQDISDLIKNDIVVTNGLKIKFQCQNLKKPFEITIKQDDRLLLAMMKCAEHLEIPLERLKFYFDGDILSSKSTPQELDLEGGECIDVKICS